jgi:membrane protein DedA with SNARE-associated domain
VTLVGFAIGRRSEQLVARLTTPEERLWANRLLSRWGLLTIVLTRLVPLVAETVAILAGTSTLGWRRISLAALAGSFLPAMLYALTGAVVTSFQNGITTMVVASLVVAGLFWLAERWVKPRLAQGKR